MAAAVPAGSGLAAPPTLLDILQQPHLAGLVLHHCTNAGSGGNPLSGLRLACRTALAVARAHCTATIWTGQDECADLELRRLLCTNPLLTRLELDFGGRLRRPATRDCIAVLVQCHQDDDDGEEQGALQQEAPQSPVPQQQWQQQRQRQQPRLTWLRVQGCRLQAADVAPLAAASATAGLASHLEHLYLEFNQLGAEGVRVLGRAQMPALRSLGLCGNRLGDRGAEALARATWAGQLTSLDLELNFLSANVIPALSLLLHHPCSSVAIGGVWPRLQSLDLESNCITASSAVALASARLPALRRLNLGRNELRCAGVAVLAHAQWMPQMEALHLEYNLIGAGGAAELAGAPLHLLQTLDLCANDELGVRGAAAIARGSFPALKTLNLSDTGLGDDGASALCRSSGWRNLEALSLQFNGIGARGLSSLARARCWPALRTLDFGGRLHSGEEESAMLGQGGWKLSGMPPLQTYAREACSPATPGESQRGKVVAAEL